MKTLETTLAEIFGLDEINLPAPNSKDKLIAIISSEEKIKTSFKIFNAFIEEYEKAKDDIQAKTILIDALKKHLEDFDSFITNKEKELFNTFRNHISLVRIQLKGKVKEVYDKAKEIVELNANNWGYSIEKERKNYLRSFFL